MVRFRHVAALLILVLVFSFLLDAMADGSDEAAGNCGTAALASGPDKETAQALQNLYQTNPAARDMAKNAVAILVFPHMNRAGLGLGGGYGEGVLLKGSSVVAYYRAESASLGLQLGAQRYGYVVFLMNRNALSYLYRSDGWEIGVGPTMVVANVGVARNISSSTLRGNDYAFIFDQRGLMAGLDLEGSKISRIR